MITTVGSDLEDLNDVARRRGIIRRLPRPRDESRGLEVNGAYLSTSMSEIGEGFLKI
jgi:hypothetical protein